MLDNILNIIKSQATNIITGNSEIPEDKKQQTIDTTTSALADGLKQQLNMGNLTTLSHLFSGDAKTDSTMNPMTETLKSTVNSALVQRVGLSNGIANGISSAIVPAIFSIFSQKMNDPNNSGFNVKSLISAFAGNNNSESTHSGGLLSSLGKLMG